MIRLKKKKLLVKLKIDDAVDAFPVHFFNGMWGCLATGIFASPRLVKNAYDMENVGGFLYGTGGALFAAEIVGILFIVAWTVGTMFPFFVILKMIGWFRVDPMEEQVGLDISHHKGAAYNMAGPPDDSIRAFEALRKKSPSKIRAEGDSV